jgi:hypothetical protein
MSTSHQNIPLASQPQEVRRARRGARALKAAAGEHSLACQRRRARAFEAFMGEQALDLHRTVAGLAGLGSSPS